MGNEFAEEDDESEDDDDKKEKEAKKIAKLIKEYKEKNIENAKNDKLDSAKKGDQMSIKDWWDQGELPLEDEVMSLSEMSTLGIADEKLALHSLSSSLMDRAEWIKWSPFS
ncbi:unnamed protein product [Protopolystoma xenopodis]|uniref:Uncharacterized protein n=1 Tax=Protopolystoma xenopodis TaxID=117903 RepID=A0A3S5C1A0_9PLAT|nr:unnamed protein product [Protopolystoma xenopodis]